MSKKHRGNRSRRKKIQTIFQTGNGFYLACMADRAITANNTSPKQGSHCQQTPKSKRKKGRK